MCLFHTGNRLHQHQCASFLSLKGILSPGYSCNEVFASDVVHEQGGCLSFHLHLGPLHHCPDRSKNQPGLVHLPGEHFLPVDRGQPFRDTSWGNHLSSFSSALGQMQLEDIVARTGSALPLQRSTRASTHAVLPSSASLRAPTAHAANPQPPVHCW